MDQGTPARDATDLATQPNDQSNVGGRQVDQHVAEATQQHPAEGHASMRVSEKPSDDDLGSSYHRINQYVIKEEIGRGSFGSVHLAADHIGREYAVKEFNKTRLRRRARSYMLRRPDQRQELFLQEQHEERPPAPAPAQEQQQQHHHHNNLHRHQIFQKGVGAGGGFLHRRPVPRDGSNSIEPMEMIREEIAIMKKLHHPNLVTLIEVLDEPGQDSLYMVMDLCKNGVVMHVGLDHTADPYGVDQCREWFRSMILGVEYLHAQGVLHRDIKPDNCLVTEDGTLKISDFGVSHMFQNGGSDRTARSAGSPAFMPPELCVPRHGEVSGRAVDIWSMGVTLYCLRYGRIPFEKTSVLELYESIRHDELQLGDGCETQLADMMKRLLEKDPQKRITMNELRVHPWVTQDGRYPLTNKDDNTAPILEAPTEAEVNAAIITNIKHLVVLLKAVQRFKSPITRRKSRVGSLQVGQSSGGDGQPQQQTDAATRERDDTAATSKGEARTAKAEKQMSSGRGQAHDPLLDHLYLNIGPSAAGPARDESVGAFVLSESPATAEDGVDIFEQAYRQEIQRIVGEHQQQQQRNEDGSERKDDSQHGRRREPTLYLTRRVEGSKRLVRDLESMAGRVIGIGGKPTTAESGKAPASKFAMLMDKLGGGKGSDEPTASPKAEDAVS